MESMGTSYRDIRPSQSITEITDTNTQAIIMRMYIIHLYLKFLII